MKKNILIVDDDPAIVTLEQQILTKNGYGVLCAYSGTEALLLLKEHTPDVILLDLMLPGINGEELLPKIKNIPVIVVSAKLDVDDKVSSLLGGAADYITKPFDTKELLARISVQLRKSENSGGVLTFDKIKADVQSFEAEVDGKPVKLTKTEFALLITLMRGRDRVLTKDKIMRELEELTPDCEENSLRTHVTNLRTKLRAACGKDYIEAVWGIGYKLTDNRS